MTGICAFVSNRSKDAEPKVVAMLESMNTRGTDSKFLRGPKSATVEPAIGICFTPGQSTDDRGKNCEFVLDGAFFEEDSRITSNMPVLEWLKIPGALAFLGFYQGGVIAGRDPLGQKPLYWGFDDEGNCACASLKVALRDIGVSHANPVSPGKLLLFSGHGYEESSTHVLHRPSSQKISESAALDNLEILLLESVERMIPDNSALAFSGGLDSALVAMASKKVGTELKLVTVGLKGQPELEHAISAASSMGLQTQIETLSGEDITNAVGDVVRTIETDNPVAVGISVPFLFACQKAKELGAEAIVAGQLSDELFGGYSRFEKLASEGNLGEAEDAMWESVLAASAGDFEPGDKISVSFGLEVRCPFAYLPLVNWALQLPFDLKLRIVKNTLTRKYILRRLAKRWGLPASVTDRPKKAFQYSSGVQKVLVKMARQKRRSLRELLSSQA